MGLTVMSVDIKKHTKFVMIVICIFIQAFTYMIIFCSFKLQTENTVCSNYQSSTAKQGKYTL